MTRPAIAPPTASVNDNGVSKLVVAQHLRERIVAGEFPPGSRLPTRSALEAYFGTTKVTVQRAFDDLTEDGFITVQGKQGTFVARTPPHLNRYALVLSSIPDTTAITGLSSVLLEESRQVAARTGRHFPLFHSFNETFDPPDQRRLMSEVRCHQLAGVIYAYNPGDCAATQLMQAQGVPVVAITHSTSPLYFPAVSIDYTAFFERALDDLSARGMRRIAVLAPSSLSTFGAEQFRQSCLQRGLGTEPYWWLPLSISLPSAARTFIHLLMNSRQNSRPDALIIADDHLVEDSLAGMNDAGIDTARFPIVAHTNFPRAGRTPHANVRLLGFRVAEVLGACLRLIDLSRAGEIVPAVTRMNAHFEHEEHVNA